MAVRHSLKLICALSLFAAACGGDDGDDVPSIDASTAIDAAAGPAVCSDLCEHLYADCMGVAVDPECTSGCTADVTDCTAAQVDDLAACADVACPGGDTKPVGQCIAAVACVDM